MRTTWLREDTYIRRKAGRAFIISSVAYQSVGEVLRVRRQKTQKDNNGTARPGMREQASQECIAPNNILVTPAYWRYTGRHQYTLTLAVLAVSKLKSTTRQVQGGLRRGGLTPAEACPELPNIYYRQIEAENATVLPRATIKINRG